MTNKRFKTAAVFSDNMVLQRGKNIKIFGTGIDCDKIEAEMGGEKSHTYIKDGKWLLELPPFNATAADENHTLTLTCHNGDKTEIRSFKNVAIGEVWLAGGQSNMEYELQNCENGKKILEKGVTSGNVRLRYYYTQKKCCINDEFLAEEEKTVWTEFNSDTAKCWSAAGYFFAQKISAELNVTVGIIGCNWGGTSASAWMSRSSLECDIDLKTYLDEYDKFVEGKTAEELNKAYAEYQEYQNVWNEKSRVFYSNNPEADWEECVAVCGENKYPGPHSPINPVSPTLLYTSMLKRIAPYTLAGIIYYQGESDDHKPNIYYKLLRGLIDLWREDFMNTELPFIPVQLPMHRYKADPDYKNWCLIREAQEKVFKTVKNTGMAVAIDCGEFNEIHPRNKKPIGERLALQALWFAYDKTNIKASAPMYKSHLVKDGGVVEISFINAEEGFTLTESDSPNGFEIAGADKVFIPAEIEIISDKIMLKAEAVPEPLYIRYLWTNYGDVRIFGKNELPLAPFRSNCNDDK